MRSIPIKHVALWLGIACLLLAPSVAHANEVAHYESFADSVSLNDGDTHLFNFSNPMWKVYVNPNGGAVHVTTDTNTVQATDYLIEDGEEVPLSPVQAEFVRLKAFDNNGGTITIWVAGYANKTHRR